MKHVSLLRQTHYSSTINKYTFDGSLVTSWNKYEYDSDQDGKTESYILKLVALSVNGSGNVYTLSNVGISGTTGGEFVKFTPDGECIAISSWGELDNDRPWLEDMAVGSDDSVYGIGSGGIYKFNSAGKYQTTIKEFEEGYGSHYPSSIAVDTQGNIYTFNSYDYTLQKLDSYGNLITQWTVSYLYLASPYLRVDAKGNVYTVHTGGSREWGIFKFTSDGELITKIATNYGGDDDFVDAAVSSEGEIYVINYYKGQYTVQEYALKEVEGEEFVVNTTGDKPDADPDDGVCDVDLKTSGEQCTLRAAIEDANRSKDTDTITFAIPTTDTGYDSSAGVFTVRPKKPLPKITDVVVVDATTQSDGSVKLSGKNAGVKTNGLHIKAEDSTVKGLVIQEFTGHGIQAESDVHLSDVKVSKNKGYGVYAKGNITIEGENCEFSDNGKSGLYTLEDVDATYGVIQVKNNGGYGITATGNVTINFVGTGTASYQSQTSHVSNNEKGGIRAIKDALGQGGTVKAFHLEVDSNKGIGIETGGDLTINGGKVCDNTGGNIEVKGNTNLSSDVVLCNAAK
ncbi:MAG: CSLREA domain-containing protein [Candidatus Brocadiales bacterium]|nr:CSLREA domain-containing protein [Candidatus Brocadiales bacterium]